MSVCLDKFPNHQKAASQWTQGRRGINPQNYLTDVLGRLPSTKITQSKNCYRPIGNLHRRTLLETQL